MTSTQDLTATTAAFDLVAYLTDRQPLVEAALDAAVRPGYPQTIYDAMRYSLLAGGKRLRPILCLASCELIGGTIELAMPTACASALSRELSITVLTSRQVVSVHVADSAEVNWYFIFGDYICVGVVVRYHQEV